MRYLPASFMKDLPPLVMGTGATICLLTFLTIAMEAVEFGKDLPLDETSVLWHLYTLLRTVTNLEPKRTLITGLLKNLPHNIQLDILQEAKGLTDQGAALLVSILEEQNRRVVALPPHSRRRSSAHRPPLGPHLH